MSGPNSEFWSSAGLALVLFAAFAGFGLMVMLISWGMTPP